MFYYSNGQQFFAGLGLDGKDPLKPVREWCVKLARADTHTGALAWFEVPIVDLSEWADVINSLEKTSKKSK